MKLIDMQSWIWNIIIMSYYMKYLKNNEISQNMNIALAHNFEFTVNNVMGKNQLSGTLLWFNHISRKKHNI